MNKKILILAMVTLTLAISGCDQELPPVQNPTPKVENKTVPIETEIAKPNTQIEINRPENAQNKPEKIIDESQTNKNPENKSQVKKMKIKAYFPDDAGINLVAVNRQIEIENDAEKYLAAVKILMNYPNEKDLTGIFPKNAKLKEVTFKDGTAFVDFDANITKSFAGGSTGEELLVSSVVKTLTEFKEVKQVRFLVDGKEIETLSGHMDLSEPIKKSDL